MTRNEPETPPAVQEARRRVRNVSIGTTALSLAIIPLVWGAKVTGIDPNVAVWSWVGAMAVGAAVYPWRRWARDAGLIREHNRLIARTDLGLLSDGETAPSETTTDPLQQMAGRIISLAEGDPAVKALVDNVMARRADLQHDLRSLEEAIEMEASLDGETGQRHSRLTEVADARRDDLRALTDALRDLHVELTVRSDTDHSATVQRIDHLLASLSAETELVALGSASDAATEKPRQRPAATRQT